MKRKLLTIICVLAISLSMTACTQNNEKKDESNNNTSTEINNNESSEENASQDSSNTNNNTATDSDTLTNNSDNADTDNSEKNNIMQNIKTEGLKGINIYCDNVKLGENISDVESIYGEASEHNYVEAAKGTYYNYKNNNFAFGCNKGAQIFEIRSFDKNLNKLNLSDIQSYFGTPDYENKTTVGEKVIGYKISDSYKLLFVFDGEILDHYSAFYPEITANLMADDEGRQW